MQNLGGKIMKKNIDPNKVSSFKNYEPSYHKYSSFCMKTKPNKRYFNGEVKRAYSRNEK